MNEGYFFVPFPPDVHRSARAHAVLNQRVADTYSGTVDVTFVAEQSVHIGSGFKSLCPDETIVRRGVTIEGAPGVPGASLKGVLRSRYEAMTRSCAGKAPKDGSIRSTTGIKAAHLTNNARTEAVFESCSAGNMCAACALFGRMSQRGRITVLDFVADCNFVGEEMLQQFGPNLHHLGKATPKIMANGTKEFEVSKLHGRKFAAGEGPRVPGANVEAVEVMKTGAMLSGSLRFFNVRTEELGGLLAALGETPRSYLKIGAGKGQRFGRIKLHGLAWDLFDHARKRVVVDRTRLDAWREAFRTCADYWETGERALVEIHHGGC